MRKLLLITAIMFGVFGLKAQSDFLGRFTLEGMAGVINYHGELNEKFFTLDQSKPSLGLGLGYKINNNLSVRGLISYGVAQAHDKYSTVKANRERNLSFLSKVYDAQLVVQYHFLDIDESRFSPYVFAGASIWHMGPYTYDTTGRYVGLRTLHTEGQNMSAKHSYNLWQVSVPFGVGIKFAVNSKVNLGWELRYHKLFTDYLDDVSGNYVSNLDVFNQIASLEYRTDAPLFSYRGDELHGGNQNYPLGQPRGNPKTKDWLYYTGLTVSFRVFGHNDSPGKGIACPKW